MLATTIQRIWDEARRAALSPEEYGSPPAKRVYDPRHARPSTWLNTGTSPRRVAEWAVNSVEVLLRTYAKCLVARTRSPCAGSAKLWAEPSARIRHDQPETADGSRTPTADPEHEKAQVTG
ncbi:hypothetical protein AB0D67_30095 [Streptosporangium sp. NPDC048047]|uniref:hypothetical protein n=1 Tax=Streptosporangium sp. NPDC048047 TaxID=3155748 RepID=UPI00341BF243